MSEIAVELRNISKQFSQRRASKSVAAVSQVNLQIRTGEFFTLLGPSGCAKTTSLRMIAGFEQPTSGEIMIQGQPMTDVPPNRRPVNTVFQNYALFPHLSVGQNVAFGLKVKGVAVTEQKKRVAAALELVQLSGLEDRRPTQLSGGQQQRVALARALVNQPSVLLLDEPLGALDLKLRKTMQIELKHLQQQVGITFIYVTHDQEEALTMSDRIGVMHEGKLLQVDDPVALYENPATRFVADFIGETNFLPGKLTGLNGNNVGYVEVAGQKVTAPMRPGELSAGQMVVLAMRPEKLMLTGADETPTSPVSEKLPGVIREAVYIGTDTRYVVGINGDGRDTLVVRTQNARGQGYGAYQVGEAVTVWWRVADARILTE